jgi:glycine hydroxymethyltransferase
MGKFYNFVRYKTQPDQQGRIDFTELRRLALESKPKMVLCGYSSYPRDYDYALFKKIADEVGALTMADVSHIGGLIAGGAMRNPCDFGFDFVTTTTHKSMRGPRGGMILCKEKHAKKIDKSVFPGLQGGPHMNAVAGAAITFGKALEPAFRDYCRQVLVNAQALSESLLEEGAQLVTGGTENHMMVLDCVKSFSVDGRVAEETLDAIAITTNKQIIPDDPNPPLRPSGIRLGTPAATTRGMREAEMKQLSQWIVRALRAPEDKQLLDSLKQDVEACCRRFPVPGIA